MCPRYGVMDALYMMNRRLIMSAVATMMIAEVFSEMSCATDICAAPANIKNVIIMALSGATPAETVTTPVSMPNGTIPGMTGKIVPAPAKKEVFTD